MLLCLNELRLACIICCHTKKELKVLLLVNLNFDCHYNKLLSQKIEVDVV